MQFKLICFIKKKRYLNPKIDYFFYIWIVLPNQNSIFMNHSFKKYEFADSISGTKIILIRKIISLGLFLVICIFSFEWEGYSLPSYARQTGLSCAACHYSFPDLNSFGRQFKLNGYTMTTVNTIEAKEDSDQSYRMKILGNLPLSEMFQSSFTHVSKDIPGQQNNSVAFPQQLSLFYAGEVTPHIGTFIQMTYDGQSIHMDNTDIRYSNQVMAGNSSLIYGVTLNNNPSVQDLWQTTPAWSFPYATSDAMPSPAKSTYLEGLGQMVAGIGPYVSYNNLLYAEVCFYRSVQQGFDNPADSTNSSVISGAAPYWRLALEHQFIDSYLEVGTFGMYSQTYLSGISGFKDNYTDIGVDAQFEHSFSKSAITLHASLIHENENRDTATGFSEPFSLNSFKIDGSLYFKKGLGATIGYFTKSGNSDPNVGSLNNLPNSSGCVFQVEYLPWFNTKFSLQYVVYDKFNGSTSNFDGSGRNASNNNTLYLLAWICF